MTSIPEIVTAVKRYIVVLKAVVMFANLLINLLEKIPTPNDDGWVQERMEGM